MEEGRLGGPYLYWKTAPQGPNCLSLRHTSGQAQKLDGVRQDCTKDHQPMIGVSDNQFFLKMNEFFE